MNTADEAHLPVMRLNEARPDMSQCELAEHIVDLTGSKSRLAFRPLPVDDPLQRQPGIAVARDRLGWPPQAALDQSLRKTIAYFDDLFARER